MDYPPFLHPRDSLVTQFSSQHKQLRIRFFSIGDCLLRTTPSISMSFQTYWAIIMSSSYLPLGLIAASPIFNDFFGGLL